MSVSWHGYVFHGAAVCVNGSAFETRVGCCAQSESGLPIDEDRFTTKPRHRLPLIHLIGFSNAALESIIMKCQRLKSQFQSRACIRRVAMEPIEVICPKFPVDGSLFGLAKLRRLQALNIS
jgi:hypothetical protein